MAASTTPMHESQQAENVSARDFVERELRLNPDASYADIQERASRVGLNVQRFLYGSARRSLGLPPRPDPADPIAGQPTVAAPMPTPVAATALAEPSGDAADGASPAASDLPASEPEPGGPDGLGAQPKKSSSFAFAVEVLRMSPDINYQDLKARASMASLPMPPIVYGRAKALLGLVPTKPRRPRAEPPRLLRQVESAGQVDRMPALDGIRSLEHLVATVRALEHERQRLRAALAAILATVDEALEGD